MPADTTCYVLGHFALPSGDCASWFSGTWSALAVTLAAGTTVYSEFRLKREELTREKAIARQIGLKIWNLINETNGLLRQLRPNDCPADRTPLRFSYATVNPIAGLHYEPGMELDPAEREMLSKTGDAEFLTSLILAFSRLRASVDALNEYKARYEELHAMMPPPTEVDGNRVAYKLSDDEFLKIAPRRAVLDQILNSVLEMIRENAVTSIRLAQEYTPLMRKHFKVKKWMSIKVPEETSLQSTE